MKPEVSAPGTDVRSAWSTSDNAYMVATGTSMATPHVTGIVAMLLQNNPNLTYNEIRKILTSTVDNSTLGSVNFTCGGIPDDTYPNNLYGYGRVNALSAVQSQEVTAPYPFPTVTPIPTTQAPTPAPTTVAPSPEPTTKPPMSSPTTKKPTPSPTTKKPTPAPTTKKPLDCATLNFIQCCTMKGCTWSWKNLKCFAY
uniref:subtilisin n=1 Tax=Globisporangium ultimum (strain ATCC 200006 / CBS 805.95 / DAOM BR144) TaxID=431595 RepID=K3X3V5_GLOUD